MADVSERLASVRARLLEASGYLRIEPSRERLVRLEQEASRPDLWDDLDAARAVTRELAEVRGDVALYDELTQRIEDVETLDEMGREEGDDSLAGEISAALAELERSFDDLELRALFTGEHDEADAVCDVHAGAGGTDAQDWAEMMVKMYQRWAEQRGFAFELDEASPGSEAGLLSATFIIRGRYAYGLLRAEKGTHRLVRISPFDAQARRQTSFASLDVVPFIPEETGEVDIDEKDLRIDTYRSSGAGGQHVNVTDSAVRITHLPTGIVTSCQNERSQHQNKAKAMQILAAKLADRRREEHKASLAAISGPAANASWGNQIRSYVQAPYQLVKDLRTDEETGNVEGVLAGDLDRFMESYLRWEREHQVGAA